MQYWKRHVKSRFTLFQTSSLLFNCQILMNFPGVECHDKNRLLEFTSSIKREIRHLRVVPVKAKKCTKKLDTRAVLLLLGLPVASPSLKPVTQEQVFLFCWCVKKNLSA